MEISNKATHQELIKYQKYFALLRPFLHPKNHPNKALQQALQQSTYNLY